MYIGLCLYIITLCTGSTTIGMCPCALLAATGAMFYWLTDYCLWCVSISILYKYGYFCDAGRYIITSLQSRRKQQISIFIFSLSFVVTYGQTSCGPQNQGYFLVES